MVTCLSGSSKNTTAIKSYIDDKLGDFELSKEAYRASVDWRKRGTAITEKKLVKLSGFHKGKIVQWHNALELSDQEKIDELIIFKFKDGAPYQVTNTDELDDAFCLEPFCVEIATNFPQDDLKDLIE